jgi:glyoxylase-like metal-dependent hydrolase (beta-lactamase superfamily II)
MTDQPPFQIQIVPVTPFQQNCSIIRAASGKAAIVDPGGEPDKLMAAAEQIDAKIEKIWLTHGHLDHAGAAVEIQRRTGAPIEGPAEPETYWLQRIRSSWEQMGWEGGEDLTPDRWLTDGDTVELDGIEFGVVFTPGHTPGHVVFYNQDMKVAFVGDVLFQGSVGRTDFPMSDPPALIESIVTKLWPLGDDMRFVPGHGPMSTFGAERQSNPFVSDAALARR